MSIQRIKLHSKDKSFLMLLTVGIIIGVNPSLSAFFTCLVIVVLGGAHTLLHDGPE